MKCAGHGLTILRLQPRKCTNRGLKPILPKQTRKRRVESRPLKIAPTLIIASVLHYTHHVLSASVGGMAPDTKGTSFP